MRLLLSTLVPVVIALAACSATSEDGGTAPSPTTSSPTATDTGTAQPAPEAAPGSLVPEPSSGGISCISRVTDSQLVAMYDPIAQAQGEVTVTGARAVGRDVRLVAAEGVLVTSSPRFGPGGLIGDDWPIESSRLAKKTDLSTRRDLRGMSLTDGQRVLPLFRVRGGPGSVLDALELAYTDAAGASATVTLPLGTRFAEGRCRL